MNLNKLHKIIIASPDRLGDTLFFTPSIRLLKKHNPALAIDILAPTELSAAVLRNNQNINKIYIRPSLAELRDVANNYDLAVDLSDSEFCAEKIQALNCTILKAQDYKYDTTIHSTENLLKIFANTFELNITEADKNYEITPRLQDFNQIRNALKQHNYDPEQDILIGLHMGCHGLARKRSRLWKKLSHQKAWPIDNFIKLARKLKKFNKNIRFVLTGTKEEMKLAKIFQRKISNSINLLDQTSILELAALIEQCKCFIANDTGTMHIACATNTTVIALFGGSNPTTNGPYPINSKHMTIAESKISDISVLTVYDAVIRTLANIA